MTEDIERKKAFVAKCRGDFAHFAANCLKIRDKGGEIRPLMLNRAQQYVHKRIEEQRANTGKVRALVLKGRQQGISTYTEGRYYWRSSLNKLVVAYILAHEQAASDSVFSMVDRYHRLNPLKPSTGASNKKELAFDKLGSQYIVGTAGAKAGGRGRTVTLFHGSEVAFWPNAADHFASSVQAVPDLPGTEIILESTANGAGGEFYERWADAEAGRSDYIAIFVPWFWQTEYVRAVDPGFELSDEKDDSGVSEAEYAAMFGLTLEQMAWRRAKIAELRSPAKFRQEYPATPAEAFVSSSEQSFIEPHLVLRARKRSDVAGYGPLIIGADPAGPGGDRFAICGRRGAKVEFLEWRDKIDTVAAAHWLRSVIEEKKPEKMYVDAGGIGHAVVSMLKSFGPNVAKVVAPVNFGGTSEHKLAKPKVAGPKNRRSEMWDRIRQWLELEEGVSIPDLDALQADLTAPQVKPLLNNDFLLESKDHMRQRGVRSPDLADALALTFASVVWAKIQDTPDKKLRVFHEVDRLPDHTPRSTNWMAS